MHLKTWHSTLRIHNVIHAILNFPFFSTVGQNMRTNIWGKNSFVCLWGGGNIYIWSWYSWLFMTRLLDIAHCSKDIPILLLSVIVIMYIYVMSISALYLTVLVMEVFRELITCILHVLRKESFRHKLEFSHPFVFAIRWCKPL